MAGLDRPGLFRPNLAETCRELQRTLAPRISYGDRRIEAFGETVAKEEAGGDLVDVVVDGRSTVAYVVDVSGHGLRAGVMMAMIKAAIRYGLHAGHSLPQVLEQLNAILPGLKGSNMFATFAAVRFDESSEVEYVSAGHVPLLHYQHREAQVVAYSMPQLPIGLFAGSAYVSRQVAYEAGDVFALLTDGLVEAGAADDAEFGLERLARTMCGVASRPLRDMVEVTRAAVRNHAPQHDDESILFIRAGGADGGRWDWDKLFDRLETELTIQ